MEKKQPSSNYAYLILVGVCFLYAGGLGGILDAAGVFFVPVCKDLGFSRGDIALYLSIYLATSVFVTPFIGKILSKYNVRIIMSIAVVLTAAAVGLMGTYTQIWQWWISGIVFGLAGSFLFIIPGPIFITNWFAKKTGMFMGIAAACSGIGAAVLSPLYTILISEFGWRNAYFAVGIIICVMILPWTMFVFRIKPADMGLDPYGWDSKVDGDREAAFSNRGVPYRKAIKSISFICVFFFAGILSYFAGFNAHLPGFAQSLGYSALFGASMVSVASIGSIAEKLIIGVANDKIGVTKTAFIELGMVILGFVGFLTFKNEIGLLCSAIFFGTQTSLFSVSVPLVVKTLFGQKDYPILFSLTRVGTGAIGCFGPATVGYLYDFYGSFYPSFILGITICTVSAILLMVAFNIGKKRLVWE